MTNTLEKRLDWIEYAIFFQTLAAVSGSLYFSTFGDPVKNILSGTLFPAGAGLIPCELCWYARILMFPMVVLSVLGLLKEDRHFPDYVFPFAVFGIFLETYHYGLQKGLWAGLTQCVVGVPCSTIDVQYLGFVTIPLLALLSFTVLTALCLMHWWVGKKKISE